ncbi:hypothetical protein ASC67_06075 [Methylibium sp. Root1272]|nr:hypothetical protein ASC67_06075 [Methylibium sp. Root1272]
MFDSIGQHLRQAMSDARCHCKLTGAIRVHSLEALRCLPKNREWHGRLEACKRDVEAPSQEHLQLQQATFFTCCFILPPLRHQSPHLSS